MLRYIYPFVIVLLLLVTLPASAGSFPDRMLGFWCHVRGNEHDEH
jgi:hypothetical protein